MFKPHPLASAQAVTEDDQWHYPMVIDVNVEREDLLSCIGDAPRVLYVSDRGTTYEAVSRDEYLMVGTVYPETLRRLSCVSKELVGGDQLTFCLLQSRLCTIAPRERHFLSYLQERLAERLYRFHGNAQLASGQQSGSAGFDRVASCGRGESGAAVEPKGVAR